MSCGKLNSKLDRHQVQIVPSVYSRRCRSFRDVAPDPSHELLVPPDGTSSMCINRVGTNTYHVISNVQMSRFRDWLESYRSAAISSVTTFHRRLRSACLD